jgi:hypothetical protein
MKKLALLLLLPVAAAASIADDFAWQWPLVLGEAGEGAYRSSLEREVYLRAQSPRMQDVVVVNGASTEVPSSLFGPDQPLARAPRELEVPWFPLSLENSSLDRDIAAISEIGSDGSLRRVQMRSSTDGASEFVIDLSAVPEQVQALVVDWAPGQAPLERRFGVAASDDLKDWSMVAVDARLLDLVNQGQRLVERRIVLPSATRARYLRLMPRRGEPSLEVTGMRVQLLPEAADRPWQWEALAGKAVTEQGVQGFEYRLPGRFPIQRADVVLPANSSSQWRLYSRESGDQPWRPAANPWLVYRVGAGATVSQSPPEPLHTLRRDRQWRLVPATPLTGVVPGLRLGYQPEVMVFLAEGDAPYSMLAGSARANRTAAPLPQLVDVLRQQRGAQWQPAMAELGEGSVLAGDAALTAAPAERDWKAWLLWALLIGGTLLVAVLAVSLLRKPGNGR